MRESDVPMVTSAGECVGCSMQFLQLMSATEGSWIYIYAQCTEIYTGL